MCGGIDSLNIDDSLEEVVNKKESSSNCYGHYEKQICSSKRFKKYLKCEFS